MTEAVVGIDLGGTSTKYGQIRAFVVKHAKSNRLLSLKAFEYTGEVLGRKLADFVCYLDPDMLVVSGGLAKAGSLILEPAKRFMEEYLLKSFKDKIPLVPSGLQEQTSAILGAAAFSWNKLESKIKL